MEEKTKMPISINALSIIKYFEDNGFTIDELKEHDVGLIPAAKKYFAENYNTDNPINVFPYNITILKNNGFIDHSNEKVSVVGSDVSTLVDTYLHENEKCKKLNGSVVDKIHEQIWDRNKEFSNITEEFECPTYTYKKTVPISKVLNQNHALKNYLNGMTVPNRGIEEPIGGNPEDTHLKTILNKM